MKLTLHELKEEYLYTLELTRSDWHYILIALYAAGQEDNVIKSYYDRYAQLEVDTQNVPRNQAVSEAVAYIDPDEEKFSETKET